MIITLPDVYLNLNDYNNNNNTTCLVNYKLHLPSALTILVKLKLFLSTLPSGWEFQTGAQLRPSSEIRLAATSTKIVVIQ